MSRELNKQKDIEVEMARQREEWVLIARVCLHFADMYLRSTRRVQQQQVQQASSSSRQQVIVPGTPRHTGIGAGARVTQTPRRRVGI